MNITPVIPRLRLVILATLSGLCLLPRQSARAGGLVVNGSFENFPVATFAPVPPAVRVPGWTAVATKGIGGQLVNKVGVGGASGITGDQFVEFSALTGDCLTLSQTISGLLVGRSYELSFDYGNPYTYPFPWDITAGVSGSPPFSDSGSGPGPDMRHRKFCFTAALTSHTITFTSSGISNLGVALDNVCLVPCEPCAPVTLPLVPGLNQIRLPGRNPCVFHNLPSPPVTPGGVITFAGASMTAGAYTGYALEISHGPNLGHCGVVIANTATTITTTPGFALKITPASLLCVRKPVTLSQVLGAIPFDDVLTVKPAGTGGSSHDYAWDGSGWFETTTSAAANDVVLDPCVPFCVSAQVAHSLTMNLCQPDYDCCCPGVLVWLENVRCAPPGYVFDLVIHNFTPATFTSLVFSPSAGVLPGGGVTGIIPSHFFGTPLPPGGMAKIPLSMTVPGTPAGGVLCFDITPWNGNNQGCTARVCAPAPRCLFPTAGLPGPCPCNNTWLLNTWTNPASGPITSIFQASTLLSAAGTVLAGTRSDNVLNHQDPHTPLCAPEMFCNKLIIPGDTPGDTDRRVVTAKTTITISAANAGLWTFGLRSDDGFAFRLLNATGGALPWSAVFGAGNALDAGNLAVFHDTPTCDTNCHAQIMLPAGDYCAEFLYYENDGPSFFEVYAVKGGFTFATATNDWRLVGYAGTQWCWPCLQGQWTVATSQRGGPAIGSFAQAEADLINSPSVLYPPLGELNFQDPDYPGTSSIGGDLPYPGNIPGVDTNFALKAWSTLHIPCDSYVLLGFQSDDATRIRIDGWVNPASLYGFRSFRDNGGGTAIGANSLLPSGKWRAEFSGHGRVTAVVRLKAGYYNIEVLHWQGTLSSSLEVFASPYNANYCYTCPRLLNSALCSRGSDTSGIPLCTPPYPYGNWAATYLLSGGTVSAVADPLADADGDGWNNKAEYTFGTSPVDGGSAPAFTHGEENYTLDGEIITALTLTLIRPSHRETRAVVEWSESLSNWQPAELMGVQPLGNDLVEETYRVPIPLPPCPRCPRHRAFMDVRAE